MEEHKILRPAPRKPGGFSLTPVPSTSDMSTIHSTDSESEVSYSNLAGPREARSPSENPSSSLPVEAQSRLSAAFPKTRSILNLTSSTLFGIYDPTGYESNREDNLNTPWGTGAQTPIRKPSTNDRRTQITVEGVQARTGQIQENENKKHARTRSLSVAKQPSNTPKSVFGLFLRSAALCLIGLAYGSLVTQLQGANGIAPVRVENIDRSSWSYLGFWAASGLVLGNLLPWVDRVWTKKQPEKSGATGRGEYSDEKEHGLGADRSQEGPSMPTPAQARNSLGADWNPVVRSIGAFVGIAFAIRRLPWQSTLQVSLTLALANPVIWYLLDRSRNGFLLSTAFSLTGASALLSINPGMLPTPTMQVMPTPPTTIFGFSSSGQQNGSAAASVANGPAMTTTTSYEMIALATWIASVLFCSSVCFGNIGRRLVPGAS